MELGGSRRRSRNWPLCVGRLQWGIQGRPPPPPHHYLKVWIHHWSFRGCFMRKLAPARVSYRHDFLISYRVYKMNGSFHISLFKVHFMLIKCTCDSKSRTLRMRYPFQSTSRPISHRNGWSFRKTLDNNDLNQIGHLMNFTQRIISVMERMRL